MASNVANTQGERAASATANRWTTRDVLTFVIFNIVIIVATMVVKLAEDAVLSPQNTFFVGSWLFPLVSTPFYLVMADRIGKRGVLGGSILLFGVLYTFMGGLYCAPVAVVGAVIGELVMWGKGSYRSIVRSAVGFFVYWATFACYGIIPYLLFKDAYMEHWARITARATWPPWCRSTRSCRGSCSCWRCSPPARRSARSSARSS